MIYLASPYTHEKAAVRYARFHMVCTIAGELFLQGVNVYSPIAHCHPQQERVPEIENSWERFAAHDLEMLDFCQEIWVVKLPGWEESKGVAAEIAHAEENGYPVRYLRVDERAVILEDR